MKLEEMRTELASHSDFKKKTKNEHFKNDFGHICIFLPKFYCELNPIERCWAQAKTINTSKHKLYYTSATNKCSMALDSVTNENIQLRKVRHYMFAYLHGGNDLEKEVKRMKKIYKPHWRVTKNN